jgi:hypothetical protein
MKETKRDHLKDRMNDLETNSKKKNMTDFRFFFIIIIPFFTVYSFIQRVISKSDGCIYLKQVPSSDGSLGLI